MKNLEKFLAGFLKLFFPKKYHAAVEMFGPLKIIPYFFFQSILLINYKVPWPVHWASIVSNPEKIRRKTIRPFPGFMPGQYIQAMNGVFIGANVRMAPGVKIISANHNLSNFNLHDPSDPIVIGDNCWLGSNSVILPGVKLADHIIVAAGAVVSKSIDQSDVVVGGVPAKIIKQIDPYNGSEMLVDLE
jgi:acetyltransferase-like isoleucine patch superfamily enzyme